MDPNEEVTWIVTQNTVENRMIDSSLTHQFSNSKKLLKSTRLLNKLLDKYRNLNQYQDYVKMKKLVKNKIRVDIEVEDEENYGEDDYSILHKMNFSNRNNIKKTKNTISNKKDSFTPNKLSETISTDIDLPKKSKKRLRTFLVTGENDDEVPVKKKRLKKSSKQCLNDKEKIHPVINEKNNSNSFETNNMDISSQTSINNTTAVLDTKNSNLLVDGTKDKKHSNNLIHKIEIMEGTLNETSMHIRVSNNTNGIIQNVGSNFHNVTPKKKGDLICSSKVESNFHNIKNNVTPKKQNDVICISNVERNVTPKKQDDVICISNVERNVTPKKQDDVTCISNVESSFHEIENNVTSKTQDDVICILNVKNNVTPKKQDDVTRISNVESSFHEIENNATPKKQDNVICSSNVNEKSRNNICSPNSSQLQKSPPKVKSTEIINKKYKIISKENSFCELPTECYNSINYLETSTPISYLQCDEKELQKNEGYADSISSSILSQSEKRTRQLKTLNLSLESGSSSSEDEISQQKDNVDKTTVLNDSVSKTLEKNTTLSDLKLNGSQDTYKKEERFHSLENINNSINNQRNACTKDLSKRKKISSKSVESTVQTLSKRPSNLEDFIKKEELVQDTTASAFALTDFSDDEEIFLIDMPITVKLADLQGQRIVLRNKLLKLGKNKYKILYKDISTQTCVFSTYKDSDSYKMSNIKPRGSILVKQKLCPLSISKYSNHDRKSYNNVHKNK